MNKQDDNAQSMASALIEFGAASQEMADTQDVMNRATGKLTRLVSQASRVPDGMSVGDVSVQQVTKCTAAISRLMRDYVAVTKDYAAALHEIGDRYERETS